MRRAFPTDDLDHIVSETSDIWRALHGSRWFVTGGTGFIGTWLLETIQHANVSVDAKIEVTVLSRSKGKAIATAPHLFGSQSSIAVVEGDVTNFDPNVGAFDVCVHAATDVTDPVKAADHASIFDVGVVGTRRVLDAALANGASRFLLTSSGAVYGPQPPELDRIPESYRGAPDPLDVRTAYGQSKRASEWLASNYAGAHSLRVAIARIFALLGPGLSLEGRFAAGNFIRDACRGEAIKIRDGRPIRSYLYIADACIWLLRIMVNGANSGAYNLGSEHAVSIADLARMIERLCNLEPYVAEEAGQQGGLPLRYVPDTTRARTELGLVEHTSLEFGLTKTINWNRIGATA